MNYYRNTRKASKKNLNYKYNNEQSLITKESENTENTECQKARKEKIQNMTALISARFHNIIASQGPLYICSCCDQL